MRDTRRVRGFVTSLAVLWFLGGCVGTSEDPEADRAPEPSVEFPSEPLVVDATALETFITARMEEIHVPGVAVAIVDRNGILFSEGYGWANIEDSVPMTPDTVTNIASISKTFTNVAVLQLRERRLFDLDDDVDLFLPFSARNPSFPNAALTVRQLLTHSAGIEDGNAYDASYACGDPAVSLADWMHGYFEPDGAFYSEEENFTDVRSGWGHSYSNVGYGLLGYLVESVSGEPFADFIRANVFEPLAMNESGWYLSDIDPDRHAVPYAWIEAGDTLDNTLFADRNGEVVEEAGFVPFCPYSFYNIPDGLVRTSVHQLARFLIAHMRGGEIDGQRILAQSTIDEIFSTQLYEEMIEDGRFVQGLTWRRHDLDVGQVWGHSGGDPGVRTHMMFGPEAGRGVILFANRAARVNDILERLLEIALGASD